MRSSGASRHYILRLLDWRLHRFGSPGTPMVAAFLIAVAASAVVTVIASRRNRPCDPGHERAAEREERWYGHLLDERRHTSRARDSA